MFRQSAQKSKLKIFFVILSIYSQFPFAADQVRVVLFRECDIRGRKLLFDSSAVEKISEGPLSSTGATTTSGSTNCKTVPQTQKCDHCKVLYQVCMANGFQIGLQILLISARIRYSIVPIQRMTSNPWRR